MTVRRKGGVAMQEDCLIRIHTVQTMDGKQETLDITSHATLQGEEPDYTITYPDEGGELDGCVTQLHVKDGRCVTISREGAYETQMILEPSVRHISQHQTPFGSFMLGVSALQVQSNMKRNGGTLRFRYCTDVDMVPLGEFSFDIQLTKPEPSSAPAAQ